MAVCDSYSESNRSFDQILTGTEFAGGRPNWGQSFTGNGAVLDKATFYLKKVGSPTGNATAIIYAHSGTFGTSSVGTGSALATSATLDVSTLTTSYALKDFTFSGGNKITLTNGTNYVVVVNYAGGDGFSNYVHVGVDNSSSSHGGNQVERTGAGVWTANSSNDACFYVYTDDAVGGHPTMRRWSGIPGMGHKGFGRSW
jgi:hypothetical protein